MLLHLSKSQKKWTLSKKLTVHTGSKIPFISHLKKPACASKGDVLELTTYGMWFHVQHTQKKILNGLLTCVFRIYSRCSSVTQNHRTKPIWSSTTGFPMSKWCFSKDSFDTFGKYLDHVRTIINLLHNFDIPFKSFDLGNFQILWVS